MNEQTMVTAFLIALLLVHVVVGFVLVRASRRDLRRREVERQASYSAEAALKPYPPMQDERF